jgi:hypothetical protein
MHPELRLINFGFTISNSLFQCSDLLIKSSICTLKSVDQNYDIP